MGAPRISAPSTRVDCASAVSTQFYARLEVARTQHTPCRQRDRPSYSAMLSKAHGPRLKHAARGHSCFWICALQWHRLPILNRPLPERNQDAT